MESKYRRTHKKPSKRSYEALFNQFPSSTIFFFINTLKRGKIKVNNSSINKDEPNKLNFRKFELSNQVLTEGCQLLLSKAILPILLPVVNPIPAVSNK